MTETPRKPAIGMVGIGLMGHGIARNLLRSGYPLTVLEHSGNQPLDDLLAAGATTCISGVQLAASADVLILCVTGSPQVEAVLLGQDGLLAGLRPGAVVIDCSTAIPSSTERMAQAVVAAGGRFLDAPMTRTPKEAAEGRLNLLVGGDAALLVECRPILASFAEHITHIGPVGAGHRMKLLHNYVSLGCVALLAEAAACSARADIDPQILVQVLAQGGGGGVALERLKPWLLAQDPSGLRFFMSNALKDLDYYCSMVTESGSARAIADGVQATYAWAVQQGHAQTWVPQLVDLLASDTAT